MKREINELRFALEHERSIRAILQEQVKSLESRLGVTEKTYDVALQDHLSYHTTEVCLFYEKTYILLIFKL